MAYPGEKPILSGGRKVTDWTPYKDHIFQCDLPGTKGGHWKFRRLFADGRLQPRARWPQVDARDGGWARIEAPATPDSRIAFRYRPAAPHSLGKTGGGRGQLLLWHRQRLGQRNHSHSDHR